MKRTFTLLALSIFSLSKVKAQVTLYEGFTAPFNPAASGWDVQNLSSATGTNTAGWRQGNAASYLTALSGAPDDYFSVDKYATSSAGATNTISCWLITPTVNLTNGAMIHFSVKAFTTNPASPERLQIYYSYGAGNNVGTTAGSATNTAGTFTNIIADINPNLTATFSNLWSWNTTFSLTGVTTPGVGRIGFRYYIPDGGDGGPNGNYIGLDEVRYQMPCTLPTFYGDVTGTSTVCTYANTSLKIYGSAPNAPTTYTWFNGATTSLTAYNFTVAGTKEIWSLGQSAAGCQHLDVSYVNIQASPTVSISRNPTGALCSGNTVTVTSGGATTYSYILGSTAYTTNPIILTAPIVNTMTPSQFTVWGKASNGCIGGQYVTFNVFPNPTVTASPSTSVICTGNTATITAQGATTYSWSGVPSTTAGAITFTGTTNGVNQYTLYGMSQQGCKSAEIVTSVTVSACTGLSEYGVVQGSVYPNPFNNNLYLENIQGFVKLYNIQGQLALETKVEGSQTVDTSRLPAGIYVMNVSDPSGGVQVFRLVKDK